MIDPGHPRLSIQRQCVLVSISRSAFYCIRHEDPTYRGRILGAMLPQSIF